MFVWYIYWPSMALVVVDELHHPSAHILLLSGYEPRREAVVKSVSSTRAHPRINHSPGVSTPTPPTRWLSSRSFASLRVLGVYPLRFYAFVCLYTVCGFLAVVAFLRVRCERYLFVSVCFRFWIWKVAVVLVVRLGLSH